MHTRSETSKIIGYCNDCKGYLCDICYQTHTKAKAFRHHAIDKGATAKQNADKEVGSLGNLDIHEQICKQHNDEKTSLFCRKHMAVICGRCLIQKHLNCENQLVDLIEVSHPSIDRLNGIRHELEVILGDAQCLENKVSVSREKNTSAKDENVKAVRDFRKDIENYLNKIQSNVENEITQVHAKNESKLTAQLKTCLEVKETALRKQQQIDSIVQKNLKSTLYVTNESLGTEIAALKQTLNEALRKSMGPLYEFKKNDVIQNLILTDNALGTIEDVHTGSDELTQTITRKQEHLQDTIYGSAGNIAPKSVTVPQVEEQKSFISTQLQRPLIKGETWNVLDVKWFKQWKSYVGYDSRDNYNVGDECANPGPIDNSSLLEENTKTIKKHLIDDLDYTLVPSEAWTALVSWYSITDHQEPLPRKVIVEGYLKSEMLLMFNIKSGTEVRLWNRYMTNMYEPLTNDENTLMDAGLYSGQTIEGTTVMAPVACKGRGEE
ncbi:UBP15-like protein [Mya arenaria]|uniref:UBP15-like protein n=1 Tax=Mya arenaria TaxID=6604 RepID=A0ABY7F272_MYAAR|nr:UBP15-like protein [Mya arenaria]